MDPVLLNGLAAVCAASRRFRLAGGLPACLPDYAWRVGKTTTGALAPVAAMRGGAVNRRACTVRIPRGSGSAPAPGRRVPVPARPLSSPRFRPRPPARPRPGTLAHRHAGSADSA